MRWCGGDGGSADGRGRGLHWWAALLEAGGGWLVALVPKSCDAVRPSPAAPPSLARRRPLLRRKASAACPRACWRRFRNIPSCVLRPTGVSPILPTQTRPSPAAPPSVARRRPLLRRKASAACLRACWRRFRNIPACLLRPTGVSPILPTQTRPSPAGPPSLARRRPLLWLKTLAACLRACWRRFRNNPVCVWRPASISPNFGRRNIFSRFALRLFQIEFHTMPTNKRKCLQSM